VSVDHVPDQWVISSTLVAVAELDRSVRFYRDVGPFEEVVRKDGVAILRHVAPGSIFLILRERRSLNGIRHGQLSLGFRSIAFNARSVGELDRIESVLRDRGCFTSRRKLADGAPEMVRGRDPDNLPLVFVSDENRILTKEYYSAVVDLVHSLDV
jgi:hypothetical protein